MSLTYRALFLLALISSGECHRVQNLAKQAAIISGLGSVDDNIAEKIAEKLSVESAWFQGGNEVCRSPEIQDPTAMLKRWNEKATKMRGLANYILQNDCYYQCPLAHKALGQRIKMWGSCMKVQKEMKEQEDKDIPILDKVLGPATDGDSLMGIMLDVQGKMLAWMQNRQYFKDYEDLPECHVDVGKVDMNEAMEYAHEQVADVAPTKDSSEEFRMMYVNAVAAQAIDKVYKQLYGEGCTRKMIRDYIERSGSAGKALDNFEYRLREAIKALKTGPMKGQSPIDAASAAIDALLPDSDLEKLTSEVPPDSDELAEGESLLQSEEVSEAETTDPGTFFLIVFIIALLFFVFVCFAGSFNFSFGGHASFSGSVRGRSACFDWS